MRWLSYHRLVILLACGFVFNSCHRPGGDFAGQTSGFSPAIGICTAAKNMKKLKAEGYDYLEESVGSFLVPSEPEERFVQKAAELNKGGLAVYACNGFLPASLKAVGAEAQHDKILAYAETVFRRARQAGVKVIVFGSGGARRIPDGYDREKARGQFVDLLKRMAVTAKKYDVVVCIEALNRGECNFINSLTEAASIAEEVNSPNVKLTADIYHTAVEGLSGDEIIKTGKYIYHCHIAEKEGRAFPGKGRYDFGGYLKALKQIGYKGGISMECKWDKFDEELPAALKYLKEQIAAANK